jgi:hypothetical protein
MRPATTPHIGYGAGMAIEDAVVLGQMVGGFDDPDALFKAFTARRFGRCRTILEGSVAIGQMEMDDARRTARVERAAGRGDPGADLMGHELWFHHTGVAVADMDASIAWWRDMLGFALMRRYMIEHPGRGGGDGQWGAACRIAAPPGAAPPMPSAMTPTAT